MAKRSPLARTDDATFDLNLAPMLDIIVSIVPMLLLSIAFVQVTMIEAPVPQAVAKAMEAADKRDDLPQISLAVGVGVGAAEFVIAVEQGGKKTETRVPAKAGALDFDRLHAESVALKLRYPDVFRVEIHPGDAASLEQIVTSMDRVRNRAKTDPPVVFTDVATGKKVETDLLFPDVVFGNVSGNVAGASVAARGE